MLGPTLLRLSGLTQGAGPQFTPRNLEEGVALGCPVGEAALGPAIRLHAGPVSTPGWTAWAPCVGAGRPRGLRQGWHVT